MKKFSTILIGVSLAISAYGERSVLFDFHNPETLTPQIATPGLKEGIDLDGVAFSCDGVEIAFQKSETGNTHVRLYGSYDAGVDLRIYDGEAMIIRALNDDETLVSAVFTVSFSGGAADADFYALPGEYVWVDNTWLAHGDDDTDDTPVSEVHLYSILQSRLYTATVTVDSTTTLASPATATAAVQYFTLDGRSCSENTKGIVLCRDINGNVVKRY